MAAVHPHLGDVRQERRSLAARDRSASSSPTARRTAASRTCSGTSSSPGASWASCGRRSCSTTGAGVAVPFAWVARLRGATVVYVESLARIDGPSLSYRLIAPDRGPALRAVAGARQTPCRVALRRATSSRRAHDLRHRRHERGPLRPAPSSGRGASDSTRSFVSSTGTPSPIGAGHASSSTSSRSRSMVETIRTRSGRRDACRRRLGDGLAREREAPGRRPAAEGASARRSTTTSSSSDAASRRPGS